MAPPSFPQLTVNLPETPFTLPPSQADVSRIAATTDPSRILVDAFDTLIDPPPVLVCGSVRLDVFTSLSSSIARKLTVELVGVEKENHPKTAGYIKQILREHIVLWEAPRGRTVDPRIVLEPEALDETRASPAPDSDVQDERPDGVENMDAASSGHDHASINSDGTTGGEVDLRHKELTVGSHEFPFTFAVPADIPPTVRVHHGAVIYKLWVTLHRRTWDIHASKEVIFRRYFPARPRSRSVGAIAPPYSLHPNPSHPARSPSADVPRPPSDMLLPPPATGRGRRRAASDLGFLNQALRSSSPHLSPPQRSSTSPVGRSVTSQTSSADSDVSLPTVTTRRPSAPPAFEVDVKTESFSGPTSHHELEYSITLPSTILRQDNHVKVLVELKSGRIDLSRVRRVECHLVERRSFRTTLNVRHNRLVFSHPHTDETTLHKPITYKLNNPTTSSETLPFLLPLSRASVGVSTPTLAIHHIVRVVVGFAVSDADGNVDRRWWWCGKERLRKVVMEVPVDVRDGIEDGEHTDSMTPPIVVVEPPRGASPIPGDEDEDAVPSTDSELRPDDDDTSPHDPDEILNLPPLDDLPPTSMTPPPSSRPAPPTSFTRRVSSLLDFRTMFGPGRAKHKRSASVGRVVEVVL